MKHVGHTYEVFGPFWPTLAIVLAVLLGIVGVWWTISTWRYNRQMEELERTLKRNVHAAPIR